MRLLGLLPALAATLPSMAAAEDPVFVGLNVPWNNFGYDIGGGAFDPNFFSSFFQQAANSGSNVARFWLHTDGRAGLEFDGDGFVTGVTDTFTDELSQLVDLAEKNNIVLQICLWSFDMCKDETGKGATLAGLISDPAKTDSYVNNALRIIMKSLVGRENILMEIINEPEWCMASTPCNTQDCVEDGDMQRFVAASVEVIHEYLFKATVGSASLKWNSPTQPPAEKHFWSDTEMMNHAPAAGCVSPALDLYNVHYYDWMHNNDWGYDPLRANTTYWGVDDKLTVVGELPAKSDFYSTDQLLQGSYDNGFAGSLFWAYNDPNFPIDDALAPMATFAKARGEAASYESLVAWLQTPTQKLC